MASAPLWILNNEIETKHTANTVSPVLLYSGGNWSNRLRVFENRQ
jgi:hypothetical protein